MNKIFTVILYLYLFQFGVNKQPSNVDFPYMSKIFFWHALSLTKISQIQVKKRPYYANFPYMTKNLMAFFISEENILNSKTFQVLEELETQIKCYIWFPSLLEMLAPCFVLNPY